MSQPLSGSIDKGMVRVRVRVRGPDGIHIISTDSESTDEKVRVRARVGLRVGISWPGFLVINRG